VRAARGRLQIEVAEDLQVHPSTISRTLAAAHYESVLEGESAARKILGSLALDLHRRAADPRDEDPGTGGAP